MDRNLRVLSEKENLCNYQGLQWLHLFWNGSLPKIEIGSQEHSFPVREKHLSLCSPSPALPSQPRVSPGSSSGNSSWGFGFTSFTTVPWMPTFTVVPSPLPPSWLLVLSQTLNNRIGSEDGFFSKVRKQKAGRLCSPSQGLTPAPWLIPTPGLACEGKGLGGAGRRGAVVPDSLPYSWPSRSRSQPTLYFLVPLSGLQRRSSWIIWLAFSQNRDPPISVYFPVTEGGGPRMGRLLGLLLKEKQHQGQPWFCSMY